MRRSRWMFVAFLAVGVAVVLGVILATSGKGPRYCKRCEFGVVQDRDDVRPRMKPRCVLNGREIDCSKQPGACPDCGE